MTKASFKLIIDDRQVTKLVKDLETVLPEKTAIATINAGNKAKQIARDLVPKDSKATMRGIISMVKVKNKDSTEVIVGFVSNPHPDKTWDGQEFSLPAWMTFSDSAINGWKAYGHGKIVHFKSGHPRFLSIAADITQDMYGKEVDTATDYILGR